MPHRVSTPEDAIMANQPTAPGDDAPMADQPAAPLTDQQVRDWDDFQERFLQDYREGLKREDAARELDYQSRKADLAIQLAQCQRERAATEKKLKAADARLLMLQEGLRKLDNDFQVHALNTQVSRNRAHYDLDARFKKSRKSGPLNADLVRQLRLVGPSMTGVPAKGAQHFADGYENGVELPAAPPDVGVETAAHADGPATTGVTICRSDGTTIGEVGRLAVEPRVAKDSAKLLLEMPVKRSVVIREGRRFGPADLESIYQSNDGRYAKWFSCMIQAVGADRPAPCDLCSRGAGPFVSCVRVDGASPRCGNCEWSRRGCNDAEDAGSGQYASTASSVEPNDSAAGRQARQARAAKADGARAKSADAGRRQIAPAPKPESSAGAPSADGHPDPVEFDLEELRNPAITMRHDGSVYTHPELMAGVPLAKINKDHPYWEPNWKEPVDLIRATLTKHEAQYNELLQAKDRPHHHKFFQGRQVNRGRENIQFLEEGPFHPFQIVAKRWVSPAITTYDTLHRLAGTLKELGKFRINVSPADWLRQRLCEIAEQEGENFNLSNTVKLLYHDPKVMALRQLSGFGNVGRPVKGMARSGGSRKRKRKESSGGSPSKRIKGDPAPEAAPEPTPEPPREPTPEPEPEPAPEPSMEDLEYEGYTDTESTCGVALGDDDFRLRSLRTGRFSTSEEMTQYWHLSPHAGLDLQLLQSVEPPEWMGGGVVNGEAADDFSVALDDVVEVGCHPDSLLVRAGLGGGERVMVLFWRERTKKRFVGLLRGRGVRAVSESWESLKWEWQKMGVGSRELGLRDFGS